jgi:DNA repair exonuclease SbcCD nuclease subunit
MSTPLTKEQFKSNVTNQLFYQEKVHIKIILHCVGKDYTTEGKGIWNYYILIPEHKCPPALFQQLWLEGEVYKFNPEARGYVTYDYYKTPVAQLGFHCGVTFYEKHGHHVGYRSVEFGCDYNHLWDQESYFVSFEEVIADVQKTADQVIELIENFKPELTNDTENNPPHLDQSSEQTSS